MLKSREELYEVAKRNYIALLERAAARYENEDVYLIVDHVGYECTRIEELFRPLWGIAPFLDDEDFRINDNGKNIHVRDFIKKIISEGTYKDSPRRLDKNVNDHNVVQFANQCVTEIAAYLVAVHFAKDQLWNPLTQEEKDSIAEWILKYAAIALKNSWPNNHYWYPIFCIEILKRLGYYENDLGEYLKLGYDELESLYVSNGWYCDGNQFGRFDYYEAWAHHTYTLLWILVADPNTEGYAQKCEKYRARTSEFLKLYTHYFDVDGGMCAYGRSLSYRFAAVSAFGLAALTGCEMDMSLAKTIILKNISYFYDNCITTDNGILGCGYLYDSTRFAENYASDGATTCYTEGFMCLLADAKHPLWTAETVLLHIERSNYLMECPVDKLDFLIQGEKDYGGVTLYNNAIHYFQLAGTGFNDMRGYYSKFCYNSRAGFALSSRDKPSFDNMISLWTEDASMQSLRGRINTVSSDKELLVSYHIPFSNDQKTRIMTYLVPLSKGYHVRIQKVELNNPYQVREGGFCIGVVDDAYDYSDGCLTWKNYISKISVTSDIKTVFELQTIHPGMHNLCPLAFYPTWKTRNVLLPGEYIFATTVFFSNDKIPANEPIVEIDGSRVTVKFEDYTKVVDIDAYTVD